MKYQDEYDVIEIEENRIARDNAYSVLEGNGCTPEQVRMVINAFGPPENRKMVTLGSRRTNIIREVKDMEVVNAR